MTSVTAPVNIVARVLIAHVCKEDSGALGTKVDRRRRFARAKPPPRWSWFHPPLKRMKACGSALLPLTDNSLPNAQFILYPDSGHGFLFQCHTLFDQHAT